MKQIFFTFIICLLFYSCTKTKTERTDKDKITQVSTDDETMNKIISDARESVNEFLTKMKNPENDERGFSVKFPFETDKGNKEKYEHIWLSKIYFKNNKYYGIIANEPYFINSMKIGDTISFDPNRISDWKYIKNDYLVGGKSIVLLLKNLSKNEREQTLKYADFKIKEFENE